MTVWSGYDITTSLAVGEDQKEDVLQKIYNLSPTDTPFVSNIGTSKALSVKHEWLTDTLQFEAGDAPTYAKDGADSTENDGQAVNRLFNFTNIQKRTMLTSGSVGAQAVHGRQDEPAYQLMKHLKLLCNLPRWCENFIPLRCIF